MWRNPPSSLSTPRDVSSDGIDGANAALAREARGVVARARLKKQLGAGVVVKVEEGEDEVAVKVEGEDVVDLEAERRSRPDDVRVYQEKKLQTRKRTRVEAAAPEVHSEGAQPKSALVLSLDYHELFPQYPFTKHLHQLLWIKTESALRWKLHCHQLLKKNQF